MLFIRTQISDMCINNTIFEPLAQSVEHLTFNQRVAGSIPAWLTFTNTILKSMFAKKSARGRGGTADALG